MKNRHHARELNAASFSASQPFSISAFSPEAPHIHFLLDDTEVMTLALRAGLLQPMLAASRKATGANRLLISPPFMVDGLFTAIVYFYGYAEAKDNGWVAVQATSLANLLQTSARLPVDGVDRRFPLKGGQPWN